MKRPPGLGTRTAHLLGRIVSKSHTQRRLRTAWPRLAVKLVDRVLRGGARLKKAEANCLRVPARHDAALDDWAELEKEEALNCVTDEGKREGNAPARSSFVACPL